jgi:hypothetical protein
MNSFKAKNLLSEMPIVNRASALEMDKGSAAYMKDEARPDYPDIDGDGDTKEPMAKAAKDKKNK